MKFVKKIGDGEITIKDNQVIDHSDKAEEWAQEFSTQQVPVMNFWSFLSLARLQINSCIWIDDAVFER